MTYSLWSRGRLIGHTDLDIECISADLRMGFLEPTDQGRQAILDATGVHAVCAKRPTTWRDTDADPEYLEEFAAACARREALDLELRDETGAVFPCAYMRITDHWLEWPEMRAEDDPLNDPNLDPELRDMLEADEAAVEEWLKEAEEDAAADAWKHGSDEADPRYDTMQYSIQVILREEPMISEELW